MFPNSEFKHTATHTENTQALSCITTGTPLHSVRYHQDYLIYGSCAHALTNHLDDEKNFGILKKRLQDHFQKKPDYMWFNQDLIPNDGLPFIGETESEHLYLATGFHTWGMTNGTLAGMIIVLTIVIKEISELFETVRTVFNL